MGYATIAGVSPLLITSSLTDNILIQGSLAIHSMFTHNLAIADK